MPGPHGNLQNTEENRKKILQHVFRKVPQVVFQQRIPLEVAPNDAPKSNSWFQLTTPEYDQARYNIEQWTVNDLAACLPPLHISFSLDLSQVASNQALMLNKRQYAGGSKVLTDPFLHLEQWTIYFNSKQTGGENDFTSLYKRLIVLLRSVSSYCVLLPAYKVHLQLASHKLRNIVMAYKISSTPLEKDALGKEAETFDFGDIVTTEGTLSLKVTCRTPVVLEMREHEELLSSRLIEQYYNQHAEVVKAGAMQCSPFGYQGQEGNARRQRHAGISQRSSQTNLTGYGSNSPFRAQTGPSQAGIYGQPSLGSTESLGLASAADSARFSSVPIDILPRIHTFNEARSQVPSKREPSWPTFTSLTSSSSPHPPSLPSHMTTHPVLPANGASPQDLPPSLVSILSGLKTQPFKTVKSPTDTLSDSSSSTSNSSMGADFIGRSPHGVTDEIATFLQLWKKTPPLQMFNVPKDAKMKSVLEELEQLRVTPITGMTQQGNIADDRKDGQWGVGHGRSALDLHEQSLPRPLGGQATATRHPSSLPGNSAQRLFHPTSSLPSSHDAATDCKTARR